MAVEPRRALVTGGAGFIGSRVVDELIARGYEVAALDNLQNGDREQIADEATFYEVDIREADLRSVVADVDPSVIIHLAALHHANPGAEHIEEVIDVNVFGTRNLLAAARELHNIQRVVFASSAKVYPPIDEPAIETFEPGPTEMVGKTKVIGEDLVHFFNEETDVPAASARLFDVYGPSARNPEPINSILEQVRSESGEIKIDNLGLRRDYVHVSDAARALVELISHDWGYRPYNIGTVHVYTAREVAQLFQSLLDRELEIVEIQRDDQADRTNLEADISRISGEIGWEPEFWLPDEAPRLLGHHGVGAD